MSETSASGTARDRKAVEFGDLETLADLSPLVLASLWKFSFYENAGYLSVNLKSPGALLPVFISCPTGS